MATLKQAALFSVLREQVENRLRALSNTSPLGGTPCLLVELTR